MRGLASAFIAVCLLLWPSAGFAIDPTLNLNQLRQTAWSAEDGGPPFSGQVAQTPDGFLWIGARNGLHRFDGQRFDHIPPVSTDGVYSTLLTRLLVSRSGELWVGYATGGLALWRNGRLNDMRMPEPTYAVTDLTEGPDGAIWVALGRSVHGLARYHNGVWRIFGPADGLPDTWVESVLPARDGSVWVVQDKALFIIAPGSNRLVRTRERLTEGGELIQDRSGNIWIWGREGTRMLPDYARNPNASPSTIAYPTPYGRTATLRFDRDGSLWIAVWDLGVVRIRNPQAPSSLTAEARAAAVEAFVPNGQGGIAGDLSLSEDREGNIWIGSSRDGLMRLNAPKIVLETAIPVPLTGPIGYQLARGHHGQVYIANATSLYVARPGQAPTLLAEGLDNPTLLCADGDDGVWYLQGDRLHRHFQGRVTRPAPPPDGDVLSYSCIQDRDGRLLFFGLKSVVKILDHGTWRTIDLPQWRERPIQRALYDRDGSIIVQRRGSPLIRIVGDRFEELYDQSALTLGAIGVYDDTSQGLVIAGEGGMARLFRGSMVNRRVEQYPWLAYSHGIARSRDGFTWLWTGQGVTRVRTDQLNRMFDTPGYQPAYEVFDRDDGLPSLIFGYPAGWPHMVQGGDGRIWLTTARGVASIDPGRLRRNTVAPAPFFRSLTVDGGAVNMADARLRAGASRLELDYGAASFTMPERVRYQYRLEGYDSGWIDAGPRQQAFYTNLKPGDYIFHLRAVNEDGVWSEPKTLAFTLPPTFLQSRVFLALCILAGALVIWLLFSLRVRQVAAGLNARLAERLAERERIARELHDTLLQGFHGLMMHFQAVAETIPKRSPARGMMEEALERADTILIEGRDRVQDLRMQTAGGLANLLATAADRLKLDGDVVTITEEGEPRDLPTGVLEEVSRVGEEALANALRHANAASIEVAIIYGRRHLRLAVRDNGVGLDEAVAQAGHRPGHFGLVGMRERANALRGELTVHSRPGAGVEVVLVVPAHVAYGETGSWLERLARAAWSRLFAR